MNMMQVIELLMVVMVMVDIRLRSVMRICFVETNSVQEWNAMLQGWIKR